MKVRSSRKKGKIGNKDGKHCRGNGGTLSIKPGGTSGEELYVQDVHEILKLEFQQDGPKEKGRNDGRSQSVSIQHGHLGAPNG